MRDPGPACHNEIICSIYEQYLRAWRMSAIGVVATAMELPYNPIVDAGFDEPEACFTQRHDTRARGDEATLLGHWHGHPPRSRCRGRGLRRGAGSNPREARRRPWPLGSARLGNREGLPRRAPGAGLPAVAFMRTHAALRLSSWRTNRRSPATSQIATNLGNGAAHVATDFRTLLGHAAVFDQASASCQNTNKFAAPADRAFRPACGATPPPAP